MNRVELCRFAMRPAITMRNHPKVQLLYAIAACAGEQKRQERMDQARHPGGNHFCPEPECHAHMLEIGLANTGWMFGKSALDHGFYGPLNAGYYNHERVKFFPNLLDRKTIE